MKKLTETTVLFYLLCLTAQSTIAQTGLALSLDGSNDYMEVPDHPGLDIDAGENFTITLWAKLSISGDNYRIVSKRSGMAGTNPGYEMITQLGGGAYGMNLRSTSGVNSGPPFGTSNVTDGTWHHLAMVVNADNNTATIYVDGSMEQQSTVSAIGTQNFANDVPLLFGTDVSNFAFAAILLDDVRVWQAALSETAITTDMTAIIDGSEANLIAAWDFENVDGGIVPDLMETHDGTLFGEAAIIDGNGSMTYQESYSLAATIPVGQGESNERVVAVNVITQGNLDPLELTELQFNFSGSTNIEDLSNAKIYYTGGSRRLDISNLFATANVQPGIITATGNQVLREGSNYFWITIDLSENAIEGSFLKGIVDSVTVAGQNFSTTSTSPGGRLILLEHKLLYSGGDFGSFKYRIPAIEKAADNSLIVAADARIDQAGDLPNNVDIVVRRSTDMGETWSESLTIADFGQFGASDPALLLDRNTGDLLCMFASHTGLFQSSASSPIRFQLCRSQDNGQTWSAPQEFTDQIYDPSWSAAWIASGSAHQLRSGRIVGAIGVRENTSNAISNFMIFSDDGGQSWDYMPNVASPTGNEAKIVELDNGNLMMNIRNQTPDLRQIVISEDGGQTWGTPYFQDELLDPYVNGDLIRYTSELDGYDKSRLLFSIAANPNSRKNLTIFLSYDEGETWSVSKVINAGNTAYSSLTVLEDGTIGCFYENGEYEAYQLYFARFSLDWLTDGNDAFLPVSTDDIVLENIDIEVFPNPTSKITTVGFNLKKQMQIKATLLNLAGIEVAPVLETKLPAGIHNQQIDMSTFEAGTYFLKVEINGAIKTKKLIIVK